MAQIYTLPQIHPDNQFDPVATGVYIMGHV
jgi:hypothetical protein